MANAEGLLYGFSEGAKAFLDTYTKMRTLKNQEKRQEQADFLNDLKTQELQAKFSPENVESERQKRIAEAELRAAQAAKAKNDIDPEQRKQKTILDLAKSGQRPIFDEQGGLLKTEMIPEYWTARAQTAAAQDPFGYKAAQASKARGEAEAQAKYGPSVTDAQTNAASFGKRAQRSHETLEKLFNDPNFDPTSYGTQIKSSLPKWLGGAKDPKEQLLSSSKLGFVASVLRKESGAAVTPQEFAQYDKIYFPQPGDSPEVTAEKRAAREEFIGTLKGAAGRAWDFSGGYQTPGSQPQGLLKKEATKEDSKVSGYAKQYGLSYDQALQLLRSRGYGG